MIITYNKIKGLKEIYKDLNLAKEILSENIKVAKDRYGDRIVALERDGKQIELKEKVLWEEVFLMGAECQAGEILKGKYPEVFEASKRENALASQLNSYCFENFGFFFSQITLTDLIDIILALIKYQVLRFLFIDKLIQFYGFSRKKISELLSVFMRGRVWGADDNVQEEAEQR